MPLEIKKEKENPLLNRKRYTLSYISESNKTPARKALMKEAAKKIGVPEDTVIIKHIYPKFGNTESKVLVDVYKDVATLEKFEDKKIIAKHRDKVEEKKE